MSRIDNLIEMMKEDNDPFLPYALALEYKTANEPAQAIHWLEKLLDAHPDYLPSYYQLAKIQEELGNEDAALKIYRTGASLAKEQNNMKILGELNEAIWFLEDD